MCLLKNVRTCQSRIKNERKSARLKTNESLCEAEDGTVFAWKELNLTLAPAEPLSSPNNCYLAILATALLKKPLLLAVIATALKKAFATPELPRR